MNPNLNSTRRLRTELLHHMYRWPLDSENLWLEQAPLTHLPADDMYRTNIQRLLERETYTASTDVHYHDAVPASEQWEESKHFWDS